MDHTPQDLKKWAKDNKRLAAAVVLARVLAQTERERVLAYTLPLFAQFSFEDDNGNKITDPEYLYLSDDDEQAAAYFAACDVAHREHGFTGPAGSCPALMAEEEQRKAENVLLDALGTFSGIDGRNYSCKLEWRDRALDLALSVCLCDQLV